MTSSKPRSPLTRLLTASVLSLALLGGITACASTESPAQPQAGNTVAPTTAAPTAKVEVDPSIPDNRGRIWGFVTKVISSRVVEFTPAMTDDIGELTGSEPSFLVLMDESAPQPDQTCDEAKTVEALEYILAEEASRTYFVDTADGELNDDNQRQGVFTGQGEPVSYITTALSRSCVPANK